jgi:hypothetical protein
MNNIYEKNIQWSDEILRLKFYFHYNLVNSNQDSDEV